MIKRIYKKYTNFQNAVEKTLQEIDSKLQFAQLISTQSSVHLLKAIFMLKILLKDFRFEDIVSIYNKSGFGLLKEIYLISIDKNQRRDKNEG